MIVNVCGFGWSGSGACLDLLREYDDATFPKSNHWEFNFLWVPDGMYDLEYKLCVKHCRIFDSDLAIKRFLEIAKVYDDKNGFYNYNRFLQKPFYDQCKEFVDNLIQFELDAFCLVHRLHPTWKDKVIDKYNRFIYWLFMNRLSRMIFNKNIRNKYEIENLKRMTISYNPNNFIELAQDFVASIISQIRTDNTRALILDQSVPPDMPLLFDHYFKEDHKTIIVRRDPRDTFITINELKGITRPVPTKVEDFIMFYKRIVAETQLPNSQSLLSIRFEDLLYNYDRTVMEIEEFLGFKNHIKKFEFFDPNKSINNTNLVELYPQYTEDVKEIERSLADYLYPFSCKVKRTSNRIF